MSPAGKETRPVMSRPSRPSMTLLLVLSVALAAACQRLDPNLTSGVLGGGGIGGIDSGSAAVTCATRRSEAYTVLSTNCAPCHQAPGMPTVYMGNFNFILDLAQLTSSTSPQSSTTLI